MNEFIKWASVLNRHLNIILDKALEELDINSSQYFYITKNKCVFFVNSHYFVELLSSFSLEKRRICPRIERGFTEVFVRQFRYFASAGSALDEALLN